MISKDTIALVRDRTDIVAVVSESVPSLKKRGRRFLGLCDCMRSFCTTGEGASWTNVTL